MTSTDPFDSTPAPNIETTLRGLTLTDIHQVGNDRIEMTTACGRSFMLWHAQDCCECVRIDAIYGDLKRLVGVPLLMVVEKTEDNHSTQGDESWTKTTYRFGTANDVVTIDWLGISNGYYSESVSFSETTETRR